jgi:hypothetical protein
MIVVGLRVGRGEWFIVVIVIAVAASIRIIISIISRSVGLCIALLLFDGLCSSTLLKLSCGFNSDFLFSRTLFLLMNQEIK